MEDTMKKIMILTSLLLSFAGTAFATALDTNVLTAETGGVGIFGGSTAANALAATGPLIRLSNKVVGLVNFDKSGQGTTGTSTGYSIFTKHYGGSKLFGTGFDTTNMYYKIVPALPMRDAAVAGVSISKSEATDKWAATDMVTVFTSSLAWSSF